MEPTIQTITVYELLHCYTEHRAYENKSASTYAFSLRNLFRFIIYCLTFLFSEYSQFLTLNKLC